MRCGCESETVSRILGLPEAGNEFRDLRVFLDVLHKCQKQARARLEVKVYGLARDAGLAGHRFDGHLLMTGILDQPAGRLKDSGSAVFST